MRKYAYLIVLTLIIGTVIFTSCRRMEQMISPAMPDAEKVEPTEMVEDKGIGIFDTEVMPGHGLIAEAFYPGVVLRQLPDFETLTPFHTWMVANIDVPHTPYERGFPELGVEILTDFAIRLRGQLKVETAGTYNFKIQSDDGAQVYINDKLVVNNDGLNSFTTANGSAMLTAGYHDLEIQYFQGPPTEIGLQWSWQPPGDAEVIVPPEVLYPPGTGEVAVEPMVEVEMPSLTAVDFTTDPDMHLYFSFDELDGNRAIDHSKYQNHGMIVGTPQLVEGRFGKALEFNGQTDYVEVPHDDSLIVNKAFTIMAWIKTPRSGGTHSPWQGIVAKGNFPRSYSLYTAQSSAEFVLQRFAQNLGEDLVKSTFETIFGKSAIEEGVVHWAHLSTGPMEGSVSMPFVLDEWQHVVAQMNENNVHRYWINGEVTDWPAWGLDDFHVQTSSGLPGANDTSPVRVGNTMEEFRHFLGVIDEVRIWRRALSEAEILEHMQQGLHAE